MPTKLDVTGLAVPGRNLLALRVLSDFRPPDEKFTRTYGAMWDPTCFKGGIWLPVRIVAKRTPKIEELLLNPDCDGNLQLDYAIENTTTGSMTVIPGVTVTDARNTADRTTREFPAVTLKPGMNRGTLSLRKEKAKLWSPGTPELYYATLYLRDSDKVLSAATERFGFREFKVNGTGFTLNGKPIYLYFESAHSVRFGGYDTADGNSVPIRTVLEGYLKKGYNMLRTAHMPVRREFQELSGVVASARLDCLVGLLCRTSREKAAGLITAGAVQRNHRETYSQGERVEEGDVLSIRKYGKFIIDQLGPLTAKGRLSVKCRKYQ